jgi:hypothetical protein
VAGRSRGVAATYYFIEARFLISSEAGFFGFIKEEELTFKGYVKVTLGAG